MKIQFTVTNQHIEAKTNSKIVADSRNYLEAVFFFVSPDWDGLTKTIVFSTKLGTYNVLLEGDTCVVPHECIIAGEISVSVFGGDRITTDVAKVKVFPSGYRVGETPKAPTPDVYTQILERLKTLQAGTVSQDDIKTAVNNYMQENPVETLTEERVKEIVNEILSEQNQPENPEEEQGIEVQSEEISMEELIGMYVHAYFEEHAADFVGPKGDPGQNGEKGDTGPEGNSVIPIVKEDNYSGTIEPGKVYVVGAVGASSVYNFETPVNEMIENVYTVKFTAVDDNEAPLFERDDSDLFITPRILSPIVSGEKYKAVYEWSEGVLRIM